MSRCFADGFVQPIKDKSASGYKIPDNVIISIAEQSLGGVTDIIQFLCVDDNFVYTYTPGDDKIVKLNIDTLAVVATAAVALDNNIQYGIQYGDYLLVVTTVGTIYKINKSDLSQAANSGGWGSIYSLTTDGTHVFFGTSGTQSIGKLNFSNLGTVAQTTAQGSAFYFAMYVDDTYVYAATADYTIKKYLKSSLAHQATSGSFDFYIHNLHGVVSETFMYLSGAGQYVRRVSKSTLTQIATTVALTPPSYPLSTVMAGNYIYAVDGATGAGSINNFKVRKIDRMTMLVVAETFGCYAIYPITALDEKNIFAITRSTSVIASSSAYYSIAKFRGK